MGHAAQNSVSKFTYKRHEPEKELLYRVFQDNLETFLAERHADTSRTPLPKFVEKELRSFLTCGVLAHGFILVSCEKCHADLPIAFSCKKKGFCPSCSAKRMSETTAHLIDNVLPHAPYRQWVVTFPHSLRFWMAASKKLTNLVHQIVNKMIMSYYIAAADYAEIENPIPGGMTFIQRAGSALNLHLHFHCLVFEGVFALKNNKPVFFSLPGPSDNEVSQTIEAISHAVMHLLKKMKYLSEEEVWVDQPDCVDKVFKDSLQFATALQASQTLMIAFGENAGKKVRRIGKGFGFREEIALVRSSRLAAVNGFTLHADRYIGENERQKLEDLISYCARPVFSHKRLSLKDQDKPDGDLVYTLKSRWNDGTTAVIFSPTEILEKLAALVPPPRTHQTRYFGILSSHSELRKSILLNPKVKKGFVASPDGKTVEKMSWSKLMMRTFKIDVYSCQSCGGRILARNCIIVTSYVGIKEVLRSMLLEYHPPPVKPARCNFQQLEFDQHPDYENSFE